MQQLAARHQQLCRDRQQRFWREAEAQRLAFQARSAAATQTMAGAARHRLPGATAVTTVCRPHTAIGRLVGVESDELELSRLAESKTAAALQFAKTVNDERGEVIDVDAVREAGFGDGEIAEIIANVALNVLTNYFNKVAETEIDFPVVWAGAAA